MKKFIYFSLPGYGHTHPTLNVARELVNRGHKVIYYSTKRFQSMIEDAGVTFRDYGFRDEIDGNTSRNLGFFARLIAELAVKKIPQLIADVKKERPDCIMHDSLSPWGKIVARATHTPAIALTTTAAYKKRALLIFPRLYIKILIRFFLNAPDLVKAYTLYNVVAKQYGVKLDQIQDVVICNENLTIVFSLKSFSPFASSFGSSFHFVGPSIYPRKETEAFLKDIPQDKKIVYISYGTVLNDDRTFFTTCINAFANTPYQVILSLGDRFDPSEFPNLPANIIIKKYVNQLEVLQRASVFVTHAGMNSSMEGLYYGVPMLLIPDSEEQRFNALRVKNMGAGIFLKKRQVNEQVLVQKVEELLKRPRYLHHAKRMQKVLHKAGGHKAAADKILSHLNHE